MGKYYSIPPSELQTVRRQLGEAIAWCSERAIGTDPRHSLRSQELQPEKPFNFERIETSRGSGFDDLSTVERAGIVQQVALKKSILLAQQGFSGIDPQLELGGGRLLGCEIDNSIWDGLSEEESFGFLDVTDIAPWDTWVYLEHGERGDILLCWVPPIFIKAVDKGAAVNCTKCIGWVDELLPGSS